MTRIQADWLQAAPTQRALDLLTAAGHQALCVGGCVRNALLDQPVADVDIATSARPDVVQALARAAGLKTVPTGIDHGTITVIADGHPFEVTTFRKDVETDGRHARVVFSQDLLDDARRRDFTMNALYADQRGQVIDPLGGLPDLHARRIRFIDDPAARIREDYLRILRFFRFSAWYGDPAQGIDPDGLAACAELADGLDGLAHERIGGEMLRLLAAPDPAPAVASMASAGALARILPGATMQALPILTALEAQLHCTPDALRRLAVLGGQDVAEALRLSRKQARQLHLLAGICGSADGPAALGYRHGAAAARDGLLARAALLQTPVSAQEMQQIERGAAQVFPVAAADLAGRYSGPALGQRLKTLQQAWIMSDFKLTHDHLMGLPDTTIEDDNAL